MRKSRPRNTHSRVAIFRRQPAAELEELKTRVTRLEKMVRALGGRTLLPEDGEPVGLSKRGRKPLLNRPTLLHHRDQLFDFCGYNWPELVWIIRRARSPEQLAKLLQAYATQVWNSEQAEHLVANSRALWEFTRSKRFFGDPLQVADALAGVPKLAWRTSWNICSETRSRLSLHWRAYRDHLRRKFPERLRELRKAKTLEEILQVLHRARTDDPIILALRNMPERVPEMLNDGELRKLPG